MIMKTDDIKVLEWVYDRLKYVHNEDENIDYMIKFRNIIENLRPKTVKKSKFKVGDKVKLPFKEEGIVVRVNYYLWRNIYDVKITKATLSNLNEIADFRETQMELKK